MLSHSIVAGMFKVRSSRAVSLRANEQHVYSIGFCITLTLDGKVSIE